MKRLALIPLLLSPVVLTACGAEDSGPPIATGEQPAVIVQVDCGDDGVANVHVTYGRGVDDSFLIGDTPYGDMEEFDRDYGTMAGFPEAALTVEVKPTKGTCLTRMTDKESGEVLTEKETAGTASVEAVVPAME